MADRIITVTDPSVVTNDTLSGYNNYSDIDGQLGTTMTPTEATNGKTITLSDGVVHEVTTKPVGTTNGEFTAVSSNAVSVDLSASTPVYFTSTLVGGVKDSDAEYTFATLGYNNCWAISSVAYTGDFEFETEISNTDTAGLMIGVDLAAETGGYFNYDYGLNIKFSAPQTFRTVIAGVIADLTPSAPTYTAGDKLRLVRVGSNLKGYYNSTELYDFGTVSTAPMYLHFQNYNEGGTKVREPKVMN